MSAKFITGVLTAAALITALAAAPAQARNNNDAFKKVVIGATTFYLLNELIREAERNNGGKVIIGHGRDNGRGHGGHGGYKTKKPPIPKHCIRSTHGKKSDRRRVATRNCLKHNYRGFKRLPKACKTSFWQRGNKRKGYGVRCLRNHGFRVSGRR
ncbi:hypothetical protein [uncultured Pelagimonas sp.]|uniref:hypothetical protein n=1 Tax=uncultured Pelagimonas sp. TaxID=1618102 RepID=UPI002622900E|nr:hypothetical protein [uncultured Pelagimonas sp.]